MVKTAELSKRYSCKEIVISFSVADAKYHGSKLVDLLVSRTKGFTQDKPYTTMRSTNREVQSGMLCTNTFKASVRCPIIMDRSWHL